MIDLIKYLTYTKTKIKQPSCAQLTVGMEMCFKQQLIN